MERLGATYADVSTAGTGAHALYIGKLPDGHRQAVFEIDDESWGENDSPPTVEIYDGKHVCVVTGQHVPGTRTEINTWDQDAIAEIFGEHVATEDRHQASHDTDKERPDLDGYSSH